MKNKKIKEWIMEAGFVLAGNLIVALGVTFFILPSDILSGGTAGIAVALEPILHLPESGVRVSWAFGRGGKEARP